MTSIANAATEKTDPVANDFLALQDNTGASDGAKVLLSNLQKKMLTPVEFTEYAHFGTSLTSNSHATAIAVDLDVTQHQLIDLGSTTASATVTLNAPDANNIRAGVLIVKQHASAAKDISSWIAGTNIGAIKWIGTEPDWSLIPVSKYQVVSYMLDGTDCVLAATKYEGETTATPGKLAYSALSSDANPTIAVNTFHDIDITSFTADRIATLPATCAVGDVVVLRISGVHASNLWELIVRNPASDDINGTDYSSTTAQNKMFIKGEVMRLVCVVANTSWRVENDGRIPQFASYDGGDISFANDTDVAVDLSGLTAEQNRGLVADLTNDYFITRRACEALCGGAIYYKNAIDSGQFGLCKVQIWDDVSSWSNPDHKAFQLTESNSTDELIGVVNARGATLIDGGRMRVVGKQNSGGTIANAQATVWFKEILQPL